MVDLEAIRTRNDLRKKYARGHMAYNAEAFADLDALLAEVERLREITGIPAADAPIPDRTPQRTVREK